jgi:hypothetical protein
MAHLVMTFIFLLAPFCWAESLLRLDLEAMIAKGKIMASPPNALVDVTRLSTSGAGSFQEFKGFVAATYSNHPDWVVAHHGGLYDGSTSVYSPTKGGVIQQLEAKAAGQIVRLAYKVPPAPVGFSEPHVSLQAVGKNVGSVENSGVRLERSWNTPNGVASVSQDIIVKKIDGTLYRKQKALILTQPPAKIEVREDGVSDGRHLTFFMQITKEGDLGLHEESMSQSWGKLKLSEDIKGEIIGFQIRPDGKVLQIQMSTGKEISYKITQKDDEITLKKTSEHGIPLADFLVETKIYPGRTMPANDNPAHGMSIDDATE